MRIIKYLFISLVMLAFTSCIDRFYLDNSSNSKPKIVIEGNLIDNCEEQTITVSYTSSTEKAEFLGLSGCQVVVVDQNSMVFNFSEKAESTGVYSGTIPEEYLMPGNQFKVIVQTPDGNRYKSSYEEMLPCPPVDSVYYLLEHHETETSGEMIDGLQFYIDFNATNYFGKFYRWIVEETYEYHATWLATEYWDPDRIYREGSASFVCYKTEVLNDINLLSTDGLTQNRYTKAKLHFVDDHSQRLLYQYSILVRQHSLSKQSYSYWGDLKKNNQATDGLYTKQPARPRGNLVNENDSTEVVLGYFSVSSETTKRIVVNSVPELKFYDVGLCDAEFSTGPLPYHKLVFFVYDNAPDGTFQKGRTTIDCVDCKKQGGVVEKPDFFK
ncbi:MAG TPA: DUF4249 domain-containing protein [Prolixibacteraceae bacterium]|nr:DUF4249 domain-containing protein [Prolixibacteraceae bacterium]